MVGADGNRLSLEGLTGLKVCESSINAHYDYCMMMFSASAFFQSAAFD